MPDDKVSDPAAIAVLDEIDELAELFPAPTLVQIGRRKVTIYPPTFRQCGPLAKLVRPVMKSGRLNYVDLMADHGDACISAIAILTRESEGWVAGLPPVLGKKLGLAVFEATAPFFVDAPGAQAIAEMAATSLGDPGDGATSSPSSSDAAT